MKLINDAFSPALSERYDELAHQALYAMFTGSVLHYVHAGGGLQGKSILDVGCGNGDVSALLKLEGAARVLGIDISPAQIALATSRHTAPGLGFRVEDAYRPLALEQAPFDSVVCVYAFHFIKNQQTLTQACRNLFDALRPGGLLVFLDITHDYVYDCAKMARLEALTSYRYDPGVAEGEVPRPWSLVRGYVRAGADTLRVDHVVIHGETIRQTLEAVGFVDVVREPLRFHDPRIAALWGPDGFNHHLFVARR